MDLYRETLCIIIGLFTGLLIGFFIFFIFPLMYHRYLKEEGLLNEKCVKKETTNGR